MRAKRKINVLELTERGAETAGPGLQESTDHSTLGTIPLGDSEPQGRLISRLDLHADTPLILIYRTELPLHGSTITRGPASPHRLTWVMGLVTTTG